jgi:hypothetical protein
MAGNWEPLIFRRRINEPYANLEQLYQAEHTLESVQNMKKAGVNLLITHYHKGFGLKAEAADIENARKLIGLCHEHGIFAGGYFGDTIILETMLIEEPEAKDWIQIQEDGTPIRYAGTQSFRYKWCMVNPAYMNYMKKILVQAISDGLDLVHFDNFLNKPEPYSCHCRFCVGAFRDFLRKKYSDAELTERFGHSNLSHLLPPTFISPLYVAWANEIIRNPAIQEWIDFKCQTVADTYGRLAEFSRSLKPDIAVECNPNGFWGENGIYLRSVDHARQLPHGSFFWDESPNKYGLLPNGALSTNIISMKMGQTFNNRVFTYIHDESKDEAETRMAESLAFNNGCLGMISFLDGSQLNASDTVVKYAKFLHAHHEWFCGTQSMAKLAVYRNYATYAHNCYAPYLQTILCQQALLLDNIAFDIIWNLDEADKYECLVLPGLECLDKCELDGLARYARKGKNLVFIGSSGVYDQWRRKYPQWQIGRLLELGKVRHIENLRLPEGAPGKEDREIWDDCFPVLDGKFWLCPENAAELLAAAVEAKYAQLIRVKTDSRRNIVAEARLAPGCNSILIHVINYEHELFDDKALISISDKLSVEDVSIISPACPIPVRQQLKHEGNGSSFTFSADKIYTLIKISLNPQIIV